MGGQVRTTTTSIVDNDAAVAHFRVGGGNISADPDANLSTAEVISPPLIETASFTIEIGAITKT